MYEKYSTEALVLGSAERGENDRIFALYTKEFGLVRARSTAVRKESSRMRYALQHYARANVSLVRGKRGWRVTGATALEGARGGERMRTFARISQLLLRLIAGEEKNEYLFSALSEAHAALVIDKSDAAPMIEIVCVARLLFALGYLSSEALSTALFTHTMYAGEHLLEAKTLRDELLSSINKAISETHL